MTEMTFTVPQLIKKKRDGEELSEKEIEFFVASLVDKTVQDSQIGAMLMAIFLQGFTMQETVTLTRLMTDSGARLKFDPSWDHLLVDKHSTGGVGDKISLVLAPALAACGLKVPMVSGRGLDFTGGTLDKLESIPGFQVQLNADQMQACLKGAGCFIAGATSALAPADGVLYKHRDVTSTVDSLPLIVSSILSKKVAEGIKALVMDVKVGRGSFLKTIASAKELARSLIDVSAGLGVETTAVLSQMDVPIGNYIGNSLEVKEAILCLKNQGSQDVKQLVQVLGAVLLVNRELVKTLEDGKKKIQQVLENGEALERFRRMIILQGVQENTAEQLCQEVWSVLPTASYNTRLSAGQSGTIEDINAIAIAQACWHLGAGRKKADDAIHYGVGVKLLKNLGEQVAVGEPWIEVMHSEPTLQQAIKEMLHSSISIGDSSGVSAGQKRVIEIITRQ